eukprot:1160715-Pelagomonas_calceolata.AAC.3
MNYRADTLFNGKHATRNSGHPGPALCPLCGAPDSTSHTLLRCTHPHINRMNINCHHQALSMCGEALSKGNFGPCISTMDADCAPWVWKFLMMSKETSHIGSSHLDGHQIHNSVALMAL